MCVSHRARQDSGPARGELRPLLRAQPRTCPAHRALPALPAISSCPLSRRARGGRASPAVGPGPAVAGARPHLAGGAGQPHHGEEAAEREGGEGGEAPDEEQGGGQHLAAAEGGVAQPGDADEALQADGRQREDDNGAAQGHHIEEQVADGVAQHPGLGPAHDGDEGHGGDEEQVGAEEVEDEAVGGAEPAVPPHQQADAPDVSRQRQQEHEGQGRWLADAQGRHIVAPEVREEGEIGPVPSWCAPGHRHEGGQWAWETHRGWWHQP